jgi:hypothetical protein
MPNAKPHIALACICEKVLREEDGVLSAIRIVDTIRIQATGVASGTIPAAELTALVSLKSGDFRGRGQVALKLRTPSITTAAVGPSYPIVLQGGENGANIIVGLLVAATDFGLYELDVYWNDEVLTTIPFRLVAPEASIPAES